jgi:hypothetical protein
VALLNPLLMHLFATRTTWGYGSASSCLVLGAAQFAAGDYAWGLQLPMPHMSVWAEEQEMRSDPAGLYALARRFGTVVLSQTPDSQSAGGRREHLWERLSTAPPPPFLCISKCIYLQ